MAFFRLVSVIAQTDKNDSCAADGHDLILWKGSQASVSEEKAVCVGPRDGVTAFRGILSFQRENLLALPLCCVVSGGGKSVCLSVTNPGWL